MDEAAAGDMAADTEDMAATVAGDTTITETMATADTDTAVVAGDMAEVEAGASTAVDTTGNRNRENEC